MAANFSLFFAFYLLTPLLPIYLSEHFHATKEMIGLVLSGYSITALLARPLSGYMVDNFRRKKVLLVVFFLFFIFFAGYLLAGTVLLFAIVRTLHGAPFGAVTVANSTAAIDVLHPTRRNEGIGYYGLGNNLAMATAPCVAVFLYTYVKSFDLLFLLAMVIAGIGLVLDCTLNMQSQPIARDGRKFSFERFVHVKGLVLALNMLFIGWSFGVLSNYLAIYGKEVLHINAGTGVYFLVLSVGLIASRLQGAKALRQGRLTLNAGEGVVVSMVGYLLFVLLPGPVGYYGSALLIGLGNGHIWPAFQSMAINLATDEHRGTANSTLLISWDLGMGVGVVTGGLVAGWLGYTEAFALAAIVNVIGTVMFFSCTRRYFLRNRLR